MNVIFEFLSSEPIENLITSIHFKVDKVIYFGYQETIDELKIRTMNFLSKYLGINSSAFYTMPHTDMQSMMGTMREVIEKEIGEGNKIYFDMTGGEDTIIASFGLLAGEYDTPMHRFNVYEDRISKLEEGSHRSIITDLEPREFKLNLDMIVEMHGGKINYSHHKSV